MTTKRVVLLEIASWIVFVIPFVVVFLTIRSCAQVVTSVRGDADGHVFRYYDTYGDRADDSYIIWWRHVDDVRED